METAKQKQNGTIVSLTIRNNTSILSPTMAFIRALCSDIGFSKKKQSHIIHTLEEILALRIENAYTGVGTITLDVDIMMDRAIFTVRDEGSPYLISADSKNLNEMLVLAYAEEYSIHIEHNYGPQIMFSFKFDERDFDLVKLFRMEYREEKLLDTDVSFRPIAWNENELVEAIGCIYAAYGYAYVHEKLYNPQSFLELLKEGHFQSFVAVNQSGQMLAHAALKEAEIAVGIPDLGVLVTKPFCRGQHIAERLTACMQKYAQEKGYIGVRAEPVAFHPFTQKLFNQQQMVPTGFLFNEINPETCGIYREGDKRNSLALAQKIFHDERVHSVILPENYRAFILGRFAALGLKAEEIKQETQQSNPYVRATLNNEMRLGTLYVSGVALSPDQNLMEQINETLHLRSAEIIDLYLHLNNPDSLYAFEQFISVGFIVTGILAGGMEADYLVMQHLRNVPLEKARIVLEPNYQEVFDELAAHFGKEQVV